MADFFEIDPITGIRTDTDYNDETGELTLIRSADVEPVIDFSRKLANEVGLNKPDIQQGWWLYAKLPPIVILQMRAKGIDVFDQNDQARMFQEINQNYPWLKTTTGREGKTASTTYFMPKAQQ